VSSAHEDPSHAGPAGSESPNRTPACDPSPETPTLPPTPPASPHEAGTLPPGAVPTSGASAAPDGTGGPGRKGGIGLFHISLVLCAVMAMVGFVWPDAFADTITTATGGAFAALDWFFMASVTGFLVLCGWLAFGRYGRLTLGPPGAKPEFGTPSWLAMLFSAGLAAGLLLWGVAEPLIHFTTPPVGEANSAEAARQALALTIFHWGLHGWAVYGMAGLVLAYFHYRHGLPFLPGAPLRHAFRGWWWAEPMARAADLIAVLAVTFGVAGSLTFGVMQLHTGLHVAAGVPQDSQALALGLLALIFVSYMASTYTSLDKGIKWLSNINVVLAIALLLFVLFAGPTAFLMRCLTDATGGYLTSLPGLTLRLYPYQDLGGWLGSWTLTYFLWWIAWAPFVGVFVARISKGRTIREFVLGVLFVPTVFIVIWFSVFGGSGIYEETRGTGGLDRLVHEDVTLTLFSLFDRLPFPSLVAGAAIVSIFIFIVTSGDSASFVLGMLTSRGSEQPPTAQKLGWGAVLAALAGALLLTGNIQVIRAGSISFALPLTLILLFQAAALLRALREDTGGKDLPGLQPDPQPRGEE
jgi:glycine betaine transporter